MTNQNRQMVVQTNLPHCVGTRRRCCFLTKTSVLFSMNHPLSNLIIAQICNATIIIRKVLRNTAHARDWLILLEVLILRRFCDKLFVQSASYINGRITREPSWYFREFAANRLSVLMHPSYRHYTVYRDCSLARRRPPIIRGDVSCMRDKPERR